MKDQEKRNRLRLRIIRYLMSCVPQAVSKPDLEDIANYADAPMAEIHAVMTGMVRDGLIEWQMFYDCPECGSPEPVAEEAIEAGIKTGCIGNCSKCGAQLKVVSTAPQLRPEYTIPIWWWSELLPPTMPSQ